MAETRIKWWRFTFRHRPASSWMGRFGGGWNWKVGISVGGSTVLVDLLTFSIRYDRKSNGN